MTPTLQRSVHELRAAIHVARHDAVHVWTDNLRAVLDRLQTAEQQLAAVRRLHRRGKHPTSPNRADQICVTCTQPWPCYTRAAIDGGRR